MSAGTASAQDFDPRGRHHGTTPAPKPHGPSHPTTPSSGPTTSPSTGTTPSPTATPEAGAPAAVLIERYTRIVVQQPGAPFPLQRLAQLYRERDGNLQKLIADMQARAGGTGSTASADTYGATVALAGLAKIDGRGDDAIQLYNKAIALKPDDAGALLALGRLLADRNDQAGARGIFERALALQKTPSDREQTLRTLMGLALDQKDWDAAKGFHNQLVKAQPRSLFVKGELGHELFNRGEFVRAEAELREYVAASQGDNRTLASALRDLGRAQAKAGETDAAIATLKRGLSASGSEAAVRTEIYETIAEIYRATDRLPELVKQLEAEHPSDYARLALLGGLYEETGDAAGALRTYGRALSVNPRQIDLRLKMIHLLQAQGELDKAIGEYDSLIRSSPQNPQFVFDECEALMQRGDRARALGLLHQLEARAGTDDDVLARLAEFYGRIGEAEQSTKVLQRLAAVAPNDPSHLVDLGDRYFQNGNVPQAVATWKRILTTVTPRSRALAALGDVYLDHDMSTEALAALKEAAQLEPNNPTYKRQVGAAYERNHDYAAARGVWMDLWQKAKQGATQDHTLLREARTRIVALWSLEHTMDAQTGPLGAAFRAEPPDLEAGRMLAEVLLRLRKLAEAEDVLSKVLVKAPGDIDSYLALERTYVQDNKIEQAIGVLEKLVVVDPKRARELYQRMAQYAVQIYRDDDAVKYAARAVELNPEDAEGHRRLGEMYRQRQDPERAAKEFREAIAKNERLYPVYFELAELRMAKGTPADIDEADRLYRRVLRSAPDEELVAKAARASMQINLGRGKLESLESDLLPLTIAHQDKPIYRRLLVEIYGTLTYPLVQKVRAGQPEEGKAARAELAKIGARAVKPLLDALSDPDEGQQRIAIDALAYVENKNAGPALFAYATGAADLGLRTRAMTACGALRDAGLLPKYAALLFPKTAGVGVPTDAVATAAAFSVARLETPSAAPYLRRLIEQGTPEMRAYASLGAAAAHDHAAVPALLLEARSAESGNVARAAAAYALGELGADAVTPTLLVLANGEDALPRQTALLALARLGSAGSASAPHGDTVAALSAALFAESEGEGGRAVQSALAVRRAGAAGLTWLAAGPHGASLAGKQRDPLTLPDEPLDAEATLRALVPTDLPVEGRVAAASKFSAAISRAGLDALGTSGSRALAVLGALGDGGGELLPLLRRGDKGSVARAIETTMEPGILPLVHHPDVETRVQALAVLAGQTSDGAEKARIDALADPSEAVRRIALSTTAANGVNGTGGEVRAANTDASVKAVGHVLEHDENWSMRVLAAEALGRLGAGNAGASAMLAHAVESDAFALVREAALLALAKVDVAAGRRLAADRSTRDAEPRVRETALRLAHAS